MGYNVSALFMGKNGGIYKIANAAMQSFSLHMNSAKRINYKRYYQDRKIRLNEALGLYNFAMGSLYGAVGSGLGKNPNNRY